MKREIWHDREEHKQQTKHHPHRRLVKSRGKHEEDSCKRQGDYEHEVGWNAFGQVLWYQGSLKVSKKEYRSLHQ